MTQYEQENDFGRGGGEVDDETMADAWRNADERRSNTDPAEDVDDAEGGQPWAKASSGDVDEP